MNQRSSILDWNKMRNKATLPAQFNDEFALQMAGME